MRIILVLTILVATFTACSEKKFKPKSDFIIAGGQMPAIVKDRENNIHLAYGTGDSILYSYSNGSMDSFSGPALIAAIPSVYTFAMRGPQIAATSKGLVITACTAAGDIYSFSKKDGGNWEAGKRVNDADTVAKEGLMGLSADGDNVFAVWLDLRGNRRNKIYGAKSVDGGKTWAKNLLVYASPDSSVCECCKPSVVIKGKQVFVLFRNWLQGSRDLYLAQSNDGGDNFKQVQKLGNGSWQLNGCPMDGGALAINEQGQVQTIWRRESNLFVSAPGSQEKAIGTGRNCTMETVHNKNSYAWTEAGEVVVITPQGQRNVLGKGSQPQLKALDDEHLLCVWENEKQVHAAVVKFN